MISTSLQVQELLSPNVEWATPQNDVSTTETYLFYNLIAGPTFFLAYRLIGLYRKPNKGTEFCPNHCLLNLAMQTRKHYRPLYNKTNLK